MIICVEIKYEGFDSFTPLYVETLFILVTYIFETEARKMSRGKRIDFGH